MVSCKDVTCTKAALVPSCLKYLLKRPEKPGNKATDGYKLLPGPQSVEMGWQSSTTDQQGADGAVVRVVGCPV